MPYQVTTGGSVVIEAEYEEIEEGTDQLDLPDDESLITAILSDVPNMLRCEALGHPLIPKKKNVRNNILITKRGIQSMLNGVSEVQGRQDDHRCECMVTVDTTV